MFYWGFNPLRSQTNHSFLFSTCRVCRFFPLPPSSLVTGWITSTFYFFFEIKNTVNCCSCFLFIWCTDVKPSDLMITFVIKQLHMQRTCTYTQAHIDINNNYLQIFASMKCSHINTLPCMCVFGCALKREKNWKLLVIEMKRKNWLEWYCNIVCVLVTVMYRTVRRDQRVRSEREIETCISIRPNGQSAAIHIRISRSSITHESADYYFLLLLLLFRFYFWRTMLFASVLYQRQ